MDSVKLNAALSVIRGLRNRVAEVAVEHEKEIDENIRRLDNLGITNIATLEAVLAEMSAATAANDGEISVLLDALSQLSDFAHNDTSIVRASEISSSLTLDDVRIVASARAAKLLKDITNSLTTRLDAVELLLQSDQTSLDTLQEIVNYITINRSTLETLSIGSIAGLQAALDLKANAADVPPNATQTEDGFMSKEDKAKLDGVEAGAEVNPTELTYAEIVAAVVSFIGGDTGALTALDALDTVPKASALADHLMDPNHDDHYMLKENDMLIRSTDKTFAGISTPLVYEAFDAAVLGNVFIQLGHAFAQSTVQIRLKITSNATNVVNYLDAVIWGRMSSSAWAEHYVDVRGGGYGTDTGSKIKVGFGTLGGLPTIWVGSDVAFGSGNADTNWGSMFRAEIAEMVIVSPTGNADLFLYDAVLGVTSVAPVTTGVFTTATWTNALLASATNPGMMSSANYSKLLALTPSASATDTVSGRLYARGNESLGIWGTNARINRIMRVNEFSSGTTPVVVLAPVYGSTLLYKKGFIGRVRVQGGTNTATQFDAVIDLNVTTGGSSAILEATTVPSSSGTWSIVIATVSGVQHYCLALTNSDGTAYATVSQNVSLFLEGMAVNTVTSGIDWNLPSVSATATYVSLNKLIPVALNSSHITKTIEANVLSASRWLVPSEKAVRTELDKKIEGTAVTTTVREAASASDTMIPTEKAVRTLIDASIPSSSSSLRYTLGPGGNYTTLVNAIYDLKKVHVATGKTIYLTLLDGCDFTASMNYPTDVSWLCIGGNISVEFATVSGSVRLYNLNGLTFEKVSITATFFRLAHCRDLTFNAYTTFNSGGDITFESCQNMNVVNCSFDAANDGKNLYFIKCDGYISSGLYECGGTGTLFNNCTFVIDTAPGQSTTFKYYNGGTAKRSFASGSRITIAGPVLVRGVVDTAAIKFVTTDIILGDTLYLKRLDSAYAEVNAPAEFYNCSVIGPSSYLVRASLTTSGTRLV